MVSLTIAPPLVPSWKPNTSVLQENRAFLSCNTRSKKNQVSITPVARLFGPATFEASKLNVLFLGVDEQKHPEDFPRTYTLTHSDITSKLTLAISESINNSQLQGWYNRLQRDEVVAEWKKVKGKMSLHVHCHISGGNFLHNLFARLRYHIFCKELPMVLKAFIHGDNNLLNHHPELQEALVWVYFHSNIPEFNKVECWGGLKDAQAPQKEEPTKQSKGFMGIPQPCKEPCNCCFPQNQVSSMTDKWFQQLQNSFGDRGPGPSRN